jgi:hypothetical protein
MRALSGAMPFVRGRLGKLRLKRIPELHVREDDTSQRGTRILRILDELEQGSPVPAEPPVDETLPLPGTHPAPVTRAGDA